MQLLPADIVAFLAPFAPLFSRPVWRHVQVLLAGAILAPGRRMGSSALRAVGLGNLAQFQRDHRVLNRAIWSGLGASRILLGLLVATFAPSGPLVVGIDETIERRRGTKIAAAGIDRDPVRSSHGHFVKVRGLRWISLQLLAPIPWAGHVWALPFLTALAPSERYCQQRHHRYQPLTLSRTPTDPGRASLASRTASGRRRGSHLCGLGTAWGGPRGGDRGRPFASGRASVRTRPGPTAAANGTTTRGRRPAPHPHDLCDRLSDPLDDLHRCGRVRRAGSTPPTSHRHGRLVPHGIAAGPHPLGAHPRPVGQVRHAGRALHRGGGRPAPDRLLVHGTLAARGDLPRSACAPGGGDESASGPTARSLARPQQCLASSPW